MRETGTLAEVVIDVQRAIDVHPMSNAGANLRWASSRATRADADAAYVHFDNVQKSYDGVTLVVKSLNLDIAKGGS